MPSAGARLWLVRHGETDWNLQGRVQGHTPTRLNETGRRQAEELARFFAGRDFAAVWASDLPRAYETADAIAEALGLQVQRTPRLRERCFGEFEGMLGTELQAARELKYRGHAKGWEGMQGVEGDEVLWERASAMLEEIATGHPGEDVVVATHGGLMTLVLRRVLGIPAASPRRFPMKNGMVAVYQQHDTGWQMLSLVDVALVAGPTAEDSEEPDADLKTVGI